jgi:inosine/xanthosine triphosphatase
MLVAVGSTNPTKITPVTQIFKHHFPDVEVVGVAVSSGVSEQPKNDDEMYQGALNRAKAALKQIQGAEYGVGIEGGLHKYSYGWLERSLIVIVDQKGRIGVGASGGLVLPPAVMQKILTEDKNLEEAMDELFGTTKIGEGIGMFGLLTKEVVTRSEGVRHGVAFALARFLHPELYAS